jgi:CRP-like cAMP-binding protein
MPQEALPDKRKLLESHPLFGRLEPEELDRLLPFLRVARYPRRAVLFHKGDPGTNMMVVLRGRVKVCTQSEDGKEVVHRLFTPGEVFGEIALLDGGDRTTDAVTQDASELLVLERRDFIPFLRSHPNACMRLMEVLCQKLRHTSKRLEDALFLEGPSRLAKCLVDLVEKHGKPVADGVRIDLHLSQQELGNIVGMSRESMNKHLRYWREEGLIRIEDGYYVITDLEALRQI